MWTHSPPHPARGNSVSYIWIAWFKLPFCHGFNKYLLSSAISLGSQNTHSCSTSSKFCAPLPRILLLCLANPSGSVKVIFFFLWNYTLLLLEQQPAPTPSISHLVSLWVTSASCILKMFIKYIQTYDYCVFLMELIFYHGEVSLSVYGYSVH